MTFKKPSPLPGFGLTLGFTLFYLSAVVLIPLGALALRTTSLSGADFWRLATTDEQYQPLTDMHTDQKFKEYQTFDNRWSRELDQISRMADDEGDGRFYYSGMAQAYLLDQLDPSWKITLAADPMINLEDLLRQALIVK